MIYIVARLNRIQPAAQLQACDLRALGFLVSLQPLARCALNSFALRERGARPALGTLCWGRIDCIRSQAGTQDTSNPAPWAASSYGQRSTRRRRPTAGSRIDQHVPPRWARRPRPSCSSRTCDGAAARSSRTLCCRTPRGWAASPCYARKGHSHGSSASPIRYGGSSSGSSRRHR